MTQLIYCLPTVFKDPALQSHRGLERFRKVTSLMGYWVMPVDRTNILRSPVRSLSLFPMPQMRPFTKTYEEICNDRARELLAHADTLGVRIYVLYSGGIDSTCLTVSLLKHATPAQKKNMTILLSHESIAENPRFFDEHIKGKIQTESSVVFAKFIGGNDILLSAEHNDLVMGNATVGRLITEYGPAAVHKQYTADGIIEFFSGMLGERETAVFYFELFERLAKSAPMPITTNFDFLWWYNFSIKWQACFSYMLFFTPPENASHMSRTYLDQRFISFYNTDEFQLWAMNNLDKRIRDTWKSYKWVLKDIIYDYTKDAEYRDHKTKVRSLPVVLQQQLIHHRYLDENARFHAELPPPQYFDPDNDFA